MIWTRTVPDMRRCLLSLGTVAVLVGCGTGTSANDVAKQACEKSPPGREAAVSPTPSKPLSPLALRKYRRQFSEAADLAAQAARDDPSWRDLADSYSAYLDAADFFLSIPDTNQLTTAQRDQAGRLSTRLQAADATIRAECRRATV